MSLSFKRVIGIAAVMLVAGCGSAGSDVTASRSDTTPTTEVAASTSPTTTTETPTTSAPATPTDSSTTTTTTTEVTTMTSPTPVGWQDIASTPDQAFPPCCASNWSGAPSPPLPATGEIPDGVFFANRVELSLGEPATLVASVSRFEQCALLPAGSCEPLPEGYEYQPDELGIGGDPRTLTIPLDGNVKVVVVGWNTDAVIRQATGTELAALLVELDAAYQEVIAAPLAAGADADAVIAGLLANPARGFGPPPVDMYGTLMYTFDSAPPLLFQGPIEYSDTGERVAIDPKTVVYLTAIEFDHGLMTLYFYAGYYP